MINFDNQLTNRVNRNTLNELDTDLWADKKNHVKVRIMYHDQLCEIGPNFKARQSFA